MIRKITGFVVGKVLDKGLDWLVGVAVAALAWLFYSPFWGGWRAICIALALFVVVTGTIAIWRREKKTQIPILTPDHRGILWDKQNRAYCPTCRNGLLVYSGDSFQCPEHGRFNFNTPTVNDWLKRRGRPDT
jgi:hypothetical protein